MSNAEMAVLGSCMVGDESALLKALAVVQPEHFEVERHRVIFRHILDLHKAGKPVDAVMVAESMRAEDKPYLFEMTNAVPSALHVEHYAGLVRRDHYRRRFVDAARRAVADSEDESTLAVLVKAVNDLQADKTGVVSLGQVAHGYVASVLNDRATRRVAVYRTGFPSIDRLGQFSAGQFVVVGARTSHGKTALMLRWAVEMAKSGRRVLFVSCEMTGIELLDRILSAEIPVNSVVIRSEKVRTVMNEVTSACTRVSQWPFYLRQGGRVNPATIEADIETVRPDVVFLDYLQLVSIPDHVKNRAAYFSDVANGLKSMAVGQKVMIVAGAQFNRDIDKRGTDAKPTLADFKESGGIEQAADISFAIHIELDRSQDVNFGQLLLLKNRNGPCMDIPVRLVMGTTKFDEMEQTLEEPKM